MKYTVTHTCGCWKVYNLFGSYAERDRKVAWLSAQPCPDCQRKAAKAANAAANAANAAINNANGLPMLDGSEKQIAWAESIRANFFTRFFALLPGKAPMPELVAILFGEKSAAKWIDRRDDTWQSLVMAHAAELKAIKPQQDAYYR